MKRRISLIARAVIAFIMLYLITMAMNMIMKTLSPPKDILIDDNHHIERNDSPSRCLVMGVKNKTFVLN